MRLSTSNPEKKVLKAITNGILREDLAQFDLKLRDQLAKQSEYLTDNEYEMYRRGKKLRPILSLLFARMAYGSEGLLPEKCYKGAASLEMLHVASLIHSGRYAVLAGGQRLRGCHYGAGGHGTGGDGSGCGF